MGLEGYLRQWTADWMRPLKSLLRRPFFTFALLVLKMVSLADGTICNALYSNVECLPLFVIAFSAYLRSTIGFTMEDALHLKAEV